jgi:hypothetical protein
MNLGRGPRNLEGVSWKYEAIFGGEKIEQGNG